MAETVEETVLLNEDIEEEVKLLSKLRKKWMTWSVSSLTGKSILHLAIQEKS